MTQIKASSLAPGGAPIGSAVLFESQQPDDVTIYGRRYLKSGLVETDSSKFDPTIFTGKTLANPQNNTIPDGLSHRVMAYGNGRFVSFAFANLPPHYSDDGGVTWTECTGGASPFGTNDATYGNGTFIAVGNDGMILTSSDGITWVQRTGVHGTLDLEGVAYGAGLFVIGGQNGSIQTSPDGATWTDRPTGLVSGNVREKSMAYGGGLFVACCTANALRVMTSPDGINWSASASNPSAACENPCYGGGIWVLGNINNTNVFTCEDPTADSWTSRGTATSGWNEVIIFGGGLFFQVTTASNHFQLGYSSDGISWSNFTTTSTTQRYDIAASNSEVVTVGNSGEATRTELASFAGSQTAYSERGDDQYIRIS